MAVVLIVWLLCAGLCAYIANAKQADVGRWALGGLVFGVFALIAVCFASPITAKRPKGWYQHPDDPADQVRWYDGHQWTIHTRHEQSA